MLARGPKSETGVGPSSKVSRQNLFSARLVQPILLRFMILLGLSLGPLGNVLLRMVLLRQKREF